MNHSHYQYANPHYTPQAHRPSGKRTWESSQASWIPSGPQHPSAPDYSNQQPQHQSHFAPVVPESSSCEDDHYSHSTKRIKVDHHHHVPPQSFVSTVEPAHVSLRSTPVEQNAPEHYQPMNAFLGQLHQQRRKHRNVTTHSHQEAPQLHSGHSFTSSSSTVSIAHGPHHTHRRLPSSTTPTAEAPPASHQSLSSSSHAETPGRTLASMVHNLHSSSMDPPPPSSHYRRPYSVKLFSNSKLA